MSGGGASMGDFDDTGAGPRRPHPLDLAWIRLGQDWSWLAVVPAGPELDVVPLAKVLSGVGGDFSARPVEFVDATAIEGEGVPKLVTDLRREGRTSRVVVAVASPLASAAALEVARSADGVVLCVLRGSARLSVVRAAVEALGREHIVCSLLVDDVVAAPPAS